eukprot:jgi/Chlat1/5096/Chrsp33S05113
MLRKGAASLLLLAGASSRQQSCHAAGAAAAVVGLRSYAAAAAAAEQDLKKTALYDFHVAHGGKMVPFAGWSMPIQYKDSIMDATVHCRRQADTDQAQWPALDVCNYRISSRNASLFLCFLLCLMFWDMSAMLGQSAASLFDVSHMCGLTLRGRDAISFIETLVVGDIAGLTPGTGTLSVFTNDKGGIIDDTVVTRLPGDGMGVYLVVNAGCREKDLKHIGAKLEEYKKGGKEVDITVHEDRALLALQGPEAPGAFQKVVKDDLSSLYFGEFREVETEGAGKVWVTRTGYTGEDGFEISVRLCGLGARDSLRLEAGLCLYGNDIDEGITPVEAGLAWTIGKRRRAEKGFPGADEILRQIKEGVPRKRVGLLPQGAPARQHVEIQDLDGKTVGEVTSGGFSPTLKLNIAMGYVAKELSKAGTELQVLVRGKKATATVAKMPFVKTTYYKRT